MPRRNKFVPTREDKQKLSKEVRKFNSKLTRIAKKNPELIPYLPDRKTVEGERSMINNRSDFNNSINSIERFMKRGAEKPIESKQGIKTTKWEKKEVQLKFNRKERIKAKQLEEADLTSEKGTMGSAKRNNLLPSKYNFDAKTPKDWNKFKEGLDKFLSPEYNEEKMKLYRENFHKAIDENFQGASADKLHNMVNSLNDKQLVEAQYNNPLLEINYMYDPHEQEEVYDNAMNAFIDYFDDLTDAELSHDYSYPNPYIDD